MAFQLGTGEDFATMDIRQLRTFNAVIESGRVSAAAQKIGVTQPAISKIIKGLEDEVGIALFVREKGRLTPTPEAIYLQKIAQGVIEQVNDAKQFLKDYGNQKIGELEIFSIPGPSLFFLPDLIAQFMGKDTAVRASLLSWNTAQVVSWIGNHQSGIGLAEWFEPHASVRLYPVALPCFCAMSSSHPLAERDTIHPKDLAGQDLSLIIPEHAVFGEIQRIFADHAVTPRIRFHSDLFVPSFTIIERTNLVGLVDGINVKNYEIYSRGSGNIVFRPFRPRIDLRISVVTPAFQPLSHIASSFANRIITELESLSAS